MFYYGVRVPSLRLLAFYLVNSFDCTEIADIKSFFLPLACGVPRICPWTLITSYVLYY